MGVGWSEFSFHKKCLSFCGGSSTFCHLSGGVERGVEKISDETGRGQKNFDDSNKNEPDPYTPPTPPRLLWNHRNMFKTGVVRANVC